MIGRTIGHYRITDRLGGGGMGVVYRAEDEKLGRQVALKFLPPELARDPEAKHRFEREARAASLLDHPNICTIYDFGEADGEQLYIAMACYEGESLAAKITGGPLSLDEAIRIVEQVAHGLGKAHSSGVIHRDIKPANVMVTSDGVVKILDFGLAKLSTGSVLTKSKTTLGTVAYMAPEQIRGEEVGPQTDIWALGMVLFELLTGRRPFRGEYTEALSYSILNEQPATITELRPDLPAEVDRIVKRMLRKDPLQRYQTVEEVLADLEPLKPPSSGSSARKRAAAEHQRLKIGAKLGPYEIVKVIGSGGMGDVYLANDTRLDRQVAVKVMPAELSEDAERKERFKREAKTISQLAHPNICTLFDVGEQEGLDYLVMEYLDGETLAEKKKPLAMGQVLKIGAQIAEGLSAAHRQGIVHRDLKPGNVIITKTGVVKLLDFGLAKDVGAIAIRTRGSDEKPLTAEGMIVGTLAYMAPEQIEGKEVDARTDIFALGAILYELVTGKRPFEGETKASLIAAILSERPKPLAERQPVVPAALGHLVGKCMEKSPEDRWDSAHDLAGELRWIAESGSPAGEGVTPGRGTLRERTALGVAFIVVAVSAILGYVVWKEATAPARSIRASINAPPGAKLGVEVEGASTVSLSPDGRFITYAAGGSLWLHNLKSGEVKSPGFGFAPFWSPDSRSVAFFAEGKLKRLDVSGGPPVTLADAREGRGGTWSREGVIVFAPFWADPLYKVSASGGAAVPVTQLAASGSETTHRWPWFLPDGKHFLYLAGSHTSPLESDVNAIYIGSLDSAEKPILLLRTRSNAIYASGHVLFVRENALMAQPFDPRELRLTGEPFRLANDVTTFSPWFCSVFAASAEGTLAYVTGPPRGRSWLKWLDRRGKELETIGESGVWDLRISPDERRAVTLEVRLSAEIWTVDLERRTANLFASSPPSDFQTPVWSPDGSRIAFSSIAPKKQSEIFEKQADGFDRERLLVAIPDKDCVPTDWSSDGKLLLFSAGGDIWTAPMAEEGEPFPFIETDVNEWNPRFSPDMRWVTFESDESGRGELYAVSFPDRRTKKQLTSGGADGHFWRRDGREILYGSVDGMLMSIDVTGSGFGAPKTLFELWPEFGALWVPRSSRPSAAPPELGALDITRDGTRFLAIVREKSDPHTITLVTHWTKALDR